MYILLPLLWGAAILLAMTGIGRVLGIFASRPTLPFGISIACGFAATSLFFSLANLAAIISRPFVLIYILAGIGCLLITSLTTLKNASATLFLNIRTHRLFSFAMAVIIALALLRTLGSVHTNSFGLSTEAHGIPFNLQDDLQAYLVFPAKMLGTGSLGREPFSERRLVASLGATYAWDSLLTTQLPDENIHLLESGIALLAFLLITANLCSALNLPRHRVALILLLLLMVLHINMNISSFMIPAGLFLALLWTLNTQQPESPRFQHLVMIALLLAGIAAAKSTLLFPAMLFPILYALYPRRQFFRSLAGLILILLLTALFLTPWLIALYQAFDIAPHILLQKSQHASPAPIDLLTWLQFLLPPVLLLLLFLAFSARAKNFPPTLIASLTAFNLTWLLTLALLLHGGGPDNAHRYIFPLSFTALSFNAAAFATLTDLHLQKPLLTTLALALVAILLLPDANILYLQLLPRDLAATFRNNYFFDQNTIDSTTALQAAAPPDAPILARLAYPSLANFKRNPIYIIDVPGGYLVNPQPDMPFYQGPEPLADFLLSKNIRYVAYSYRNQANFPEKELAYRLTDPDPQDREPTRRTFDFQSNLRLLGRSRLRLYDDGANFLLDLATKNPMSTAHPKE